MSESKRKKLDNVSCSARRIADQLDDLAHAMRKVGAQLERHGEDHCHYALARSGELLGAAEIAREWAKNLRVEKQHR